MLTEADTPTGVPNDLRSPSQDSVRTPGSASPTSSAASTNVKVKKNGFPTRTSSKLPPPPPIDVSPLPPVTPTKAAKLLGIKVAPPIRPGRTTAGSPLAAQHDGVNEHDTIAREPPARAHDQYGWEEQFEAADKAALKDSLATKTLDTDTEPAHKISEYYQPKSKGFWSTTAKKMLDTPLIRKPNTPIPSHVTTATSFTSPAYMYADGPYANAVPRIGSSQPNSPGQNTSPDLLRPLPPLPPPRRKSKRKNGRDKDKFVDMMAPITESSRDDMGAAYRSVSENVQPGAVSEDTPTDESSEKEKEKIMVHGKPAELSKAPVRSPLQALEADCLDAAEVAHMQKVKEDHEEMKREFASMSCSNCGTDVGRNDDDEVSISSSIDLDEEPTLHVATPMTVRRVLPGEIKIVKILARRVCLEFTAL